MIKKKYSLKGKKNFDKVYKLGQRKRGQVFGICKLKNRFEYNRFGVVISAKKISKASKRNKVKRIIKKIIKLSFDKIDSPFDYVITVLTPLEKINENEVEKEIKFLLKI